MGAEPVTPPLPSKHALDLGVRFCPDSTCLPCKLLFGGYAEALGLGAEHLIMLGGLGTCRLGYSVETQVEVLRELGYEFTPHVVDIFGGQVGIVRLVQALSGCSPSELVALLRFVITLTAAMDEVEQKSLFARPRERVVGSTSRLRHGLLSEVGRLPNRQAADEFRERLPHEYTRIGLAADHDLVRVGLVGDPYTLSTDFANGGIEQELGRLGAEVERSFWMSEAVRLDPLALLNGGTRNRDAARAAAQYLARDVGGFGRRSLGEAIRLGEAGCDGLIHVAPFSCAPEVMVANILGLIHTHRGVPLLHVSLDEQTSTMGLQTRLEAFVDLLRQRRGSRHRTVSSDNAPDGIGAGTHDT